MHTDGPGFNSGTFVHLQDAKVFCKCLVSVSICAYPWLMNSLSCFNYGIQVQVKLPIRRNFKAGSPSFRDSARSTSNSATQSLCSSGSTSICCTRQFFLSSDG